MVQFVNDDKIFDIYYEDGKVKVKGDADFEAEMFFETVKQYLNMYIDETIEDRLKQEKENKTNFSNIPTVTGYYGKAQNSSTNHFGKFEHKNPFDDPESTLYNETKEKE